MPPFLTDLVSESLAAKLLSVLGEITWCASGHLIKSYILAAGMSSRLGRRQQLFQNTASYPWPRNQLRIRFSSRRLIRTFVICLAFVAILPPIFFHLRFRRFHQVSNTHSAILFTIDLLDSFFFFFFFNTFIASSVLQ